MSRSGAHLLSKNDCFLLLGLIHASLSCTTKEDLRSLVSRLKYLFPYEFAVCALFSRGAFMDASHFVNAGFPADWCNLYITNRFAKLDPIVLENAKNGQGTQHWADTFKKYDAKFFVSCARDFGLKDGYSHGVRTPSGDMGSLFSFAGSSVRCHPRTEFILEHVVPHLDQALKRIVEPGSEKPNRLIAELSSREREILNWAKDGKSTWEISVILSISTNTVKFHVKNIMEKLGVVSRTQAVAVALHNGLIRMN